MSVVSHKEYGGGGANGDYGVRRSAKANTASLEPPGSRVLVHVLPFPAGRTHGSGEDGMSALLHCLVVKVGLIVMCAFLPSSHSVLRHTFLTYLVGFEGEIREHNFTFFALNSGSCGDWSCDHSPLRPPQFR